MFVAHTKLTQLVTRQSEEEEIWRWSGELETTIGCLLLSLIMTFSVRSVTTKLMNLQQIEAQFLYLVDPTNTKAIGILMH
jgi:hypothetical protein